MSGIYYPCGVPGSGLTDPIIVKTGGAEITDPSAITAILNANKDCLNCVCGDGAPLDCDDVLACIQVDTPAAFSSGSFSDGQEVSTRGRLAVGDGAGDSYIYHSIGRPASNTGFYFDGPGVTDYFRLRERSVASSKKFGAVGDGVADDTAALQSMFDAVQQEIDAGRLAPNVRFDPGTYLVTSTLTLPRRLKAGNEKTGTTFKISGDGAKLITNAPITIFQLLPADPTQETEMIGFWTVHIEGLTFRGDELDLFVYQEATVNQIGIEIGAAYTAEISRCRFTDLDYGIKSYFTIQLAIRDCYFSWCNNGVSAGPSLVSGSNGTKHIINNCRAYGNLAATGTAFKVVGGGIVSNCVVEGFRWKYGFDIDGSTELRKAHAEAVSMLYIIRGTNYQGSKIHVDGLRVGAAPQGQSLLDASPGSFGAYVFDNVQNEAGFTTAHKVGFMGFDDWSSGTDYPQGQRIWHANKIWVAHTGDPLIGEEPGIDPVWTDEGHFGFFQHSDLFKSAGTSYSFLNCSVRDPELWAYDPEKWVQTNGVTGLPSHLEYHGFHSSDLGLLSQRSNDHTHVLAVNDAAPGINHGTFKFITANTSPTVYTDFVGSSQEVEILVNDSNTTFQHGGGFLRLRGQQDFKPAQFATIKFRKWTDGLWREVSRTPYTTENPFNGNVLVKSAGAGANDFSNRADMIVLNRGDLSPDWDNVISSSWSGSPENNTMNFELATGPTTRIVAATLNAIGSLGIGISDPIEKLEVGGAIAVTDGIAAPAATFGKAKIYVDTADGSLKIKFGDGIVKTIVTDA